jgi:replicative DNA helicase
MTDQDYARSSTAAGATSARDGTGRDSDPLNLAPHSVEAEEAVLGSILMNPEALHEVAAFLSAEDFFILRHGWIYEAFLRLHERSDALDTRTLAEELRAQERLDDIGGEAYLNYLPTTVPTALHAEVYGHIVERAAIRRRLLGAAGDIAKLAHDEDRDINQVIDQSEASLFAVTERRLRQELVPIRVAISQYFDRIEELRETEVEALGVPTGFLDLDKLLGGLQKSDLTIIAGRPGMGKTSFLLTLALNAARQGSARVAIFSMEMSNEQLVQRMIATETGISSHNLRLGQVTDAEWARFVEATDNLSKLKIFFDDSPAVSAMQLRTKCRRLYREHGLDLIIVDYLQLMNAGTSVGRDTNRVQEITYISRSLKELARELNVPLLSAAQLSRAVEQRQDKRPQLSDLRESGCLTGDTLVTLADSGRRVPIRELAGQAGFDVWAMDDASFKLERAAVSRAFSTGIKPVYRLTTRLGRTIRATANHKFLTIHGWKRLDELLADDRVALPRVLPDAGAETITRAEPAYAGPALYKQNVSRERAAVLVDVVQSETLACLAESDVYWDEIDSILPDGEEEVFDLTVPGPHNFVADNIIVHNSIEQDADIVMFLYRDEVYNEATEHPGEADVIVAKHRNGPTGVVTLLFRKELTKFVNLRRQNVNLSDI